MLSNRRLWEMLQFFDGLFPSGAFAHSFGLETLVQEGAIHNESSALGWLEEIILRNWATSEALAAAQVWAAARSQTPEDEFLTAAARVDAYLTASRSSAEGRAGALLIGRRIWREAAALFDEKALCQYWDMTERHAQLGNGAVALSVIGAMRGWGEDGSLQGLAYWSTAGMVQSLVRLVPLGQSAGQRILHQLGAAAHSAVARAQALQLEDMGSTMPLWDIAAMRHQDLYSRLYRS